MTFFRVLKEDRLLAVCFVLLTLAGLRPLFVSSLLPFVDMNLTTGHGAMLFDVADADHPVTEFYFVRWAPVPYWTSYVLAALADAIGGAFFAVKALVGILVVLIPASVIRLLVALKRDPRLGLWAFMLNYERNLWAGWTAYLLGMAFALIALAWLIESDTPKRALKVTAMAALVAVTHIQALAFLAVAGAFITFSRKPTLRRLGLHTLGLSGGLLATGPWLYELQQSTRGGVLKTLKFKMDTPGEKITHLFKHTFDTFDGEFISNIPALTFWCLCLGPLVIAALGKRIKKARMAPAMAVMLASLFLYMVLPFAIHGVLVHKHNYVRYGSYILVGALFIPRTRLRGRYALALIPGIACALAMDGHMARHLAVYQKTTGDFTRMIGTMEPGSRLLPLIYKRKNPTCKLNPMGALHGLLAGNDRLFNPHFFRTKHIPVNYQPMRLPPPPQASPRNVSTPKFRKLMLGYDYALIQGTDEDPFRYKEVRHYVTEVKTAGFWRLYKLNHDAIAKEPSVGFRPPRKQRPRPPRNFPNGPRTQPRKTFPNGPRPQPRKTFPNAPRPQPAPGNAFPNAPRPAPR